MQTHSNVLTLPYLFTPRDYQIELYAALDSGIKRAICVWNRRSGKDLCVFNYVVKKSQEVVGTYYYCLPEYSQGNKIIWSGMHDGMRFLDHIPPGIIRRMDQTKMLVELTNGSIIQVVGVDNIDSLMGSNPIMVVLSEYSLMHPHVWDYLRPILAQNNGVAIFLFTPRGKNHAEQLLRAAQVDPEHWFVSIKNVEQTHSLVAEAIERERIEMYAKHGDDALFMQEYYCSFNAPTQGAYYGDLMNAMEAEGRIGKVAYNPALPVHTAWDIGMRDHTVCWFLQAGKTHVSILNYHESWGRGSDKDVLMLQEMQKQYGYVYGNHYFPHDADADEKSSGKSCRAVMEELGLRDIVIVPRIKKKIQAIQQVRMLLPVTYIDQEKCDHGIDALKSYTKIYDERRAIYHDEPLHDWASHPCDALAQFAWAYEQESGAKAHVIQAPMYHDPY